MDSARIVHASRSMLARRLERCLESGPAAQAAQRCGVVSAELRASYDERIDRYMAEADFGPDDVRRASYLNVFTGLAAYELLREAGFSEQEAFDVYGFMCAPMRRIAHLTHRWIDALPHAYRLVRDSIISDLTGPKRISWSTKLIRNDDYALEYEITRCFYHEVCRAHGCPEFTRAFCEHDDYAYGSMHRHVKFTRLACFGCDGSCCHDRFERVQ